MDPIFEHLEGDLRSALSGLDVRQLQLRPAAHADKWTIQQITQHLLLTYTLTQRTFEARLIKARPTEARPSLPQRLGQIWITNLGIFPGGRKAPQSVQPESSDPVSGDRLLQTVHEQLAALDLLCNQAQAVFANRQAISHQVLGPLSVHQWRRFHLVHTRHHARQITAIRADHKVS